MNNPQELLDLIEQEYIERERFQIEGIRSSIEKGEQSSFKKSMWDFDRSIDEQLKDLISDPSIIYEIIHLYHLWSVTIIKKTIEACIVEPKLPMHIRIECALSLGMDWMYKLVPFDDTIPVEIRMKYLIDLHKSDYNVQHHILDILFDDNVSINYRYRQLVSINNAQITLSFIQNEDIPLRNRILACQLVLDDHVHDFLWTTARNKEIDKRSRADAADILHHYYPNASDDALQLIRELGGGNTVYENTENVHTSVLDENRCKWIHFLEEECRHLEIATSIDHNLPEDALFRLEVDQTRFSTSLKSYRLWDLFILLYTYIQNSKEKNILLDRLHEEMTDMSGTCTTGYIGRLMNVLQGISFTTMTITWEDQIKANFQARLNALIKLDPDQDNILAAMTSSTLSERRPFTSFFLKHISSIGEELRSEFTQYISENEWDVYFTKAILHYE